MEAALSVQLQLPIASSGRASSGYVGWLAAGHHMRISKLESRVSNCFRRVTLNGKHAQIHVVKAMHGFPLSNLS